MRNSLLIISLVFVVAIFAQSNYEVLLSRPDITGLTGGTSTELDGIVTAGLAEGTMVAIFDGSETRIYRLTVGTNEEDSPGIIRPDDFANPGNAKVWIASLSSDPEETGLIDNVIGTQDTMIAHWDSLRHIPTGFADGVDDTGHFEPNTIDTNIAHWGDVRDTPADIADGDDLGFVQLRANGETWLADSVTFVEGTNITLTQTGDTIEIASIGGGPSLWADSTTYIMVDGQKGIFGYGNVGLGVYDSTHVNLGVACTTGNGANSKYATVGGGLHNIAGGDHATVCGGRDNIASGNFDATVGGGSLNIASGSNATVGGGMQNTASNDYAIISGGSSNTASGYASAIPGGSSNDVSGEYSFAFGNNVNVSSAHTAQFFSAANPGSLIVGGNIRATAFYGDGSGLTGMDDGDWADSTTYIMVNGQKGVFGYGNVAYGTHDSTHVNLGVACTTGASGSNSKYCTVGGGKENTASHQYATVGGGVLNTASGEYSAIPGGRSGSVSGNFSFAFGNTVNVSSAYTAQFFSAANPGSLIVGGNIRATAFYGDGSGLTGMDDGDWADSTTFIMVDGPKGVFRYGNYAYGTHDSTHVNLGTTCTTGTSGADFKYCTVIGGHNNTAGAAYSIVGGGWNNIASGNSSSVSGGHGNVVSGDVSSISGGHGNVVSGDVSSIVNGFNNTASEEYSFIGGGSNNTISARYAFIGGGYHNEGSGQACVVGGGNDNAATEEFSFVGGGMYNSSDAAWSFIGGGYSNTTTGTYTIVGGGKNNTASSECSAVNGGENNVASGSHSYIGGGRGNIASVWGATIAGGESNALSGINSAIPGGKWNTDSSDYSLVFGENNLLRATADYSVLFGVADTVAEDSTFVVGLPYTRIQGATYLDNVPDDATHDSVLTIDGGQVKKIAMTEVTGYDGHSLDAADGSPVDAVFVDNEGNVGIGITTPYAPLQFANTTSNRKIALWSASDDDHQFYGLGVNDFTFRYQVNATAASHVFYAGTSDTTSSELFRIKGNGEIVVQGQIKNVTDPTEAQDVATKAYVDTYAPITYEIGDFAQGGVVFWIDETGQHGLIAATADQSTSMRWYAGSNGNTQAKGDGPFAGEANTSIIIAAQVAIGDDGDTYAARICNELQITEGGKTYGDWFLPAKQELYLMYQNKAAINTTAIANGGGGFADEIYWSSTETSSDAADRLDFEFGTSDNTNKSSLFYVRAVRAF